MYTDEHFPNKRDWSLSKKQEGKHGKLVYSEVDANKKLKNFMILFSLKFPKVLCPMTTVEINKWVTKCIKK